MSQSIIWARRALLGFAVFNISLLITAGLNGRWIVSSQNQAIPTDFVSFWSTSRQLQKQPAAQVYDWNLHRAVETELLGPSHDGQFPWLNPPTLLLAVAPLAFLPYPIAFLCWVAVTLTSFVASLRTILPSRWTFVGACAFPASLWTASVGQNGFLTAALVAGALGLIERRPLLAGFFLGLLTYKPQFGILFPIALAAGGKWRVIAAASVTTAFLMAVTGLAFGIETWLAFLNSIPLAEKAVLLEGRMGNYKLQTPYGAAFWLGGNIIVAWTVQAMTIIAAIVLVAWVWRSRASLEVKNAALGVCILLATPYAFIYDFPILAVPIAFLIKASISRGFIASEVALIALSCALIYLFPWIQAPVGLLAVCLIAIAVAQRARIEGSLRGLAPTTFASSATPR